MKCLNDRRQKPYVFDLIDKRLPVPKFVQGHKLDQELVRVVIGIIVHYKLFRIGKPPEFVIIFFKSVIPANISCCRAGVYQESGVEANVELN